MNYLARVRRLQKSIQEKKCDAFLISNVKDILYLTGLSLSTGKVLLTLDKAFLIVDGRYFESCQSKSPIPVVLAEKNTLWDLLGQAKKIGTDSESISYQAFVDLEMTCNERAITLLPMKGVIQELRCVKDADEIESLRRAAQLGSEGFDYLRTQIVEGITEEELAYSLELFWRKNGASGFSFAPIIAFGAQSSMPHYRAGKAKLQKGDQILVDIGVELHHYNSDMTRVLFFGDVNPKLKEIHGVVYKALQAALALCRPGVLAKDLDGAAREVIATEGYGPNFTHSLGHGVGLEIHEAPWLRQDPVFGETVIKEGMVFTVEPGIYLPGIGGVRLEDMVVITKDGYENLTKRDYTFYV